MTNISFVCVGKGNFGLAFGSLGASFLPLLIILSSYFLSWLTRLYQNDAGRYVVAFWGPCKVWSCFRWASPFCPNNLVGRSMQNLVVFEGHATTSSHDFEISITTPVGPSMSNSPATRFSDVEQRPTLLSGPPGPLAGATAQSPLEGAGGSKGKGKGCQAASTEKAVDDEWSSSDDDASDEECGSPQGESRSSTPTPHPCRCRVRQRRTGVSGPNARRGPADVGL